MSIQSPRILHAKQRTWQYWFADGFNHLLLGLALLSISICDLFPPPRHAFWQLGLCAVLLGLYVALILCQRQILDWLKTKITYPRTGYVQSPFDPMLGTTGMVELGLGASDERRAEAERLAADHRKRLLLAASLAVLGSFAMLFIENRWAPTVVSVLLALALWALRKRERVSWITIVGLPVLGICMTIFVAPGAYPPHRMAWLIAGWGALFVLEGAIALTRYLLHNPGPQVAKP